MRILWIGEYTHKLLLERMMEYGYKPMSITVAQSNFIDALKTRATIDTIGGCRLPFRGFGSKMIFEGESWSEKDGSRHVFVDLITLPYIELLFKTRKIKKAVKRWAEENRNDDCFVMIYGLHSPYLSCILPLRKILKNVVITCIVPDLPEYYDFNQSRLKTLLKAVDIKNIYRQAKLCDRFVLFAESMKERLNIDKDSYIVVEGCVRRDSLADLPRQTGSETKKILFYSGSLNRGYGIETLLEAFSYIDGDDYELQIAGAGATVPDIQEAARADGRIKYLGYIADRDRLRILQCSAMLLLCMIPPHNPATKYCFPSKIFEYMASGNPVMIHRLQGIGDEYYDYLIPFDDDTPQEIAGKIRSVAELDEVKRYEIGRQGREFVLKNKNNLVQSERIYRYAVYGEK